MKENGDPGRHRRPQGGQNAGRDRAAPDPNAPADSEPVEQLPPRPEPPRIGLTFSVDGEAWIAIPAGAGAYGTGHTGLAPLQAIHFARASAPDAPVFEALLPTGRFETLFESELVALFRTATRIVPPEPGAPLRVARFRRGEGLS